MIYKSKLTPLHMKFQNEASGYKIYLAHVIVSEPELSEKLITIVGIMPHLITDKEYDATLEEKAHSKYGINYEVKSILGNIDSQDEEQNFLKCLCTESQYEKIIAIYPQPITAIRKRTFDYRKIRGMSERSWFTLQRKVEENEAYMQALAELAQYGISFDIIKKAVKKYSSSEKAIETIRDNPYRLYFDLYGVGWKKADEVALAMGFDIHCDERIDAAVIFCLESVNDGSTLFDIDAVREKTESLLSYSFNSRPDFLDILSKNDYLWNDGVSCSLKANRDCEEEIARHIMRLLGSEKRRIIEPDKLDKIISDNEEKLKLKYTDAQKSLFSLANENNVVIMTGYAGTGKSQSLCGLLDLLDHQKKSYMLSAPTGKASQQIERYTKREAKTIHRMLCYDQETNDFWFGLKAPLPTDFLIVDEFSMTDIFLFRSVLRALRDNTKLLLVGDPKQLSAVGIGNCLKDLINSETVPVVALTQVFRQALDNGALFFATAVREGRKIYDDEKDINSFGLNNDCILWNCDKETVPCRLVSLYKQLLKLYDAEDIAVISPIRKNRNTSVEYLNRLLQEIYNPAGIDKPEIETVKGIFRTNDKVIHIKNNYNAEWLDDQLQSGKGSGVFNGNIGKIISIKPDESIIYVKYDGFIIAYDHDMFEELELSYAITTHKMQGSSAKVVIFILNNNSFMLNNRNNIYTALTRTTDKSYILAEYPALEASINKEETNNRKTFLEIFLKPDIKGVSHEKSFDNYKP